MSETTSVIIDNTYGALYIGVVMAMGLWGVASLQLYYYFNLYWSDPWILRTLVVAVWVLDTAHQGLITHACYIYLVTNYANPLFLYKIVLTLEVMVLLSAIVCLLVQTFLLYRVWRLSNANALLVAPLSLLSLTQFVATTIFFAKGSRMTSFTEVPTIGWLSKLSNSLAAGTDICIALTLIYLLHRSRTGFKRSETLINRLIVFTINTGAATSICALFAVIFDAVYPKALIYVAFYVCISRMYTNTLLAALNARRMTRDGFTAPFDQGSSMIVTSELSGGRSRDINRSHGRSLAIRVQTETNSDSINLNEMGRRGKEHDDSDHKSYTYDKASFSRSNL